MISIINKMFGFTLLIKCCQKGENTIFDKLIESGVSLNSQCNKGNTAIMYACLNCNIYCFERLLKAGASLQLKNNNRRTVLMMACKHRDLKYANLLLKYGALPDTIDNNGFTPLISACMRQRDCTNMIQLLLRYGASLDITDKDIFDVAHKRSTKMLLLEHCTQKNYPKEKMATRLYKIVLLDGPKEISEFEIRMLYLVFERYGRFKIPSSSFNNHLMERILYSIDKNKHINDGLRDIFPKDLLNYVLKKYINCLSFTDSEKPEHKISLGSNRVIYTDTLSYAAIQKYTRLQEYRKPKKDTFLEQYFNPTNKPYMSIHHQAGIGKTYPFMHHLAGMGKTFGSIYITQQFINDSKKKFIKVRKQPVCNA
jgi:hypothetical protein